MNRLFLIWLAWTGLQFCTDLCSSDHCWGKCNLVISMTFYTCKTAVARPYLMLWCCTSTALLINIHALPVVLGTWNNWNWWQKMPPSDSLVSMDHIHQKESSQALSWFDFASPCPTQTAVLMHVNGTYRYIGQVIISWFFSNFTLLKECFLVISVWHLKKKPSIPQAQHNLCCRYDN